MSYKYMFTATIYQRHSKLATNIIHGRCILLLYLYVVSVGHCDDENELEIYSIVYSLYGLVWFDSFYTRASTITAIYRRSVIDSSPHRPTNEPRFTASGLPWRSPNTVLTEVDVS